jgi:lia operon protein LiaG
MKNTLLLTLAALLLAVPAELRAQEYKTKFSNRQNRKVVLDMQGSDVVVEGYDGDELVIQGKGGYEAPPAQANGLRAVYNSAQDNTRLGLSVTSEGDNTVRIVRASRHEGEYIVRVPRLTSVIFNQASWIGSGDVLMRDVAGRIEVNLKSGDMKLLNVSGPVVANTISGDIVVKFQNAPTEPSAISTVSGDVDITLPGSTKASFSMRTISGEIYTDFDLAMGRDNSDNLQHIGGQTVDGRANGGGTSFALKSVSGDIFVRKAK